FFLIEQPNLPSVVWGMLMASDWALWFFISDSARRLLVLNRHIRDTLTALVCMVGVLNAAALAVWMSRDRRLPAGLDRTFAVLWIVPLLFVCVFLVIAKPGYVLPIAPPAALVIAGYYSRQRPRLATALISAQAVVNAAHFLFVTPSPDLWTGG